MLPGSELHLALNCWSATCGFARALPPKRSHRSLTPTEMLHGTRSCNPRSTLRSGWEREKSRKNPAALSATRCPALLSRRRWEMLSWAGSQQISSQSDTRRGYFRHVLVWKNVKITLIGAINTIWAEKEEQPNKAARRFEGRALRH